MPLRRSEVPRQSEAEIKARELLKPPDFTAVDCPPGFLEKWHLHWVNTSPMAMSMAESMGYVPVSADEVKVPETFVKPDKTVRYIDLILCKRPREEYEAQERLRMGFEEQKLKGRVLSLHEAAARQGISLSQRLRVGKPHKIGEPESPESTIDIAIGDQDLEE